MALNVVEARVERGAAGQGVNQSHFIECDDGEIYLVKPRQADKQFANELIGIALGTVLGVPMPQAALVTVTEQFRSVAPNIAPRYAAGTHFASRKMTEPHFSFTNPEPGLVHSEVRNLSAIYSLVVFDELVANGDRRNNAGNMLMVRVTGESPKYEFRAIDHGHILTGPNWTDQSLASHAQNPLVPVYQWFQATLTSKAELLASAKTAEDATTRYAEIIADAETQLTDADQSAVVAFLSTRAEQLAPWIESPSYSQVLTNLQP